jgi:UDP-galactopyranose mutase
MRYDFLIVGAGFAGVVCAQQLAQAGKSVLIVDKRPHIGGNAYDCCDQAGIRIHPYGPHIFHTNSKRIFEYLSRFTAWRFYEHRVLASVDDKLVPVPINLTTLKLFYGIANETEAQRHLESVRCQITKIETSEDLVLSSVGHDLCEKIFRGYTLKHWGLNLSQLPATVAARIPPRTDDDDRYFTDTYQFMPANGYTSMFGKMLEGSSIDIRLSTSFDEIKSECRFEKLIYTGPIDEYYNHRFGRLPYRSVRFEHEHLPMSQFQPVGTVNYPNDHSYTRITEFKYLTGQEAEGTSIVREYPTAEGDPFYPIPGKANEELYQRYQALAKAERNVCFVGRLAQYRYYNMDQVVGAALKAVEVLLGGEGG